MMEYYSLDPGEHMSMKFSSKYNYFHSNKWAWICRLEIGGHFVSVDDNVDVACLILIISILPLIGSPSPLGDSTLMTH